MFDFYTQPQAREFVLACIKIIQQQEQNETNYSGNVSLTPAPPPLPTSYQRLSPFSSHLEKEYYHLNSSRRCAHCGHSYAITHLLAQGVFHKACVYHSGSFNVSSLSWSCCKKPGFFAVGCQRGVHSMDRSLYSYLRGRNGRFRESSYFALSIQLWAYILYKNYGSYQSIIRNYSRLEKEFTSAVMITKQDEEDDDGGGVMIHDGKHYKKTGKASMGEDSQTIIFWVKPINSNSNRWDDDTMDDTINHANNESTNPLLDWLHDPEKQLYIFYSCHSGPYQKEGNRKREEGDDS